jgi:hypothetical protein
MLERFRGMGAEFILSPGFSAFIFLFVAPVAAFLAYLTLSREAVVGVRGPNLYVANPTFPWLKAVLPSRDVVSIETDWCPGTSHARLAFGVTPEQFARQNCRGPWDQRKDGKLYLDLLNTDHTPEAAAVRLRRILFGQRGQESFHEQAE